MNVRNRKWMRIAGIVIALYAILVACAPTPTPVPPTKAPQPTRTPAAVKSPEPTQAPVPKYNQAPQLAELVNAGKLPPVNQRLPDEPLVVETFEGIGQYGGVWRRGFLGTSDVNNYASVVYDALVRFSPDGTAIEPKIAAGWEASKDFSVWTIKLRKGAKWSDGAPFTADDILFWYKDVLLNKDLTPTLPAWMKNKDGSAVEVKRIDDYSAQWVFKDPNATFLMELATKDGADHSFAVFLPSHYLKQFHAGYADKSTLDNLLADAKLKNWSELFAAKNSPLENPDRPTMAAWMPVTRAGGSTFVLTRNPYYIGVDKEGNQLPYIDEVHFRIFPTAQALNLAAILGDLDEQEQHINVLGYPVLKENEQKQGKYRVLLWSGLGGTDANVIFNQTYTRDPDLGRLLQSKDFRIAMSYAINRNLIKGSTFLGFGEIRQPVPALGLAYYPGDEYAKKYTEYHPDEANRILDRIGLNRRDGERYRMYPGTLKRVALELSVTPAFAPWPDAAQLIAFDWFKVGIKTDVQIRGRSQHIQLRQANELQVEIWNQDTAGLPFAGNSKYDPRSPLDTGATIGPLWKLWYDTNQREGVAPPAEIKKIVELIDKGKTVNPEEQAKIAQEIFRIWVDNLFEIGTVGLTPMDQGVAVVNANMRNVPTKLAREWMLRTPGNARTEQFYFAK